MDKNILRNELKAARRALSTEEITEKSSIINVRLSELVRDKLHVMAYLSAFNEVCVDGLITELIADGRTVSVPVTDKEAVTITPSVITSLADIRRGAYGIREPSVIRTADTREIDAVIVPGIGFDRRGGRIGFGKGYYDRLLRNFSGLKIGVCYDLQVVCKIDTDENDVPMDMIVTERNCYVI